MNTKQLYTAPEADLLVVRFEEGFLTGSKNVQSILLPSFTEDSEEDW